MPNHYRHQFRPNMPDSGQDEDQQPCKASHFLLNTWNVPFKNLVLGLESRRSESKHKRQIPDIYIYILVRVWINIGADSLHFVWFNQLCDTFTIVCWPLSMGKASISSSSLPMFWHCSDRQLGRYLGSSRLSVKLQFVAVADWWLDMFITYHNTCNTFNTTVFGNSFMATQNSVRPNLHGESRSCASQWHCQTPKMYSICRWWSWKHFYMLCLDA